MLKVAELQAHAACKASEFTNLKCMMEAAWAPLRPDTCATHRTLRDLMAMQVNA